MEEAYHGGQKNLQFSFRERCPACGGTGSVNQKICQNCGGTGSKAIVKTLDVKIPSFIREGNKIRLKGQGGEGSANGGKGDLLLTVKILPHSRFTLKGTTWRQSSRSPLNKPYWDVRFPCQQWITRWKSLYHPYFIMDKVCACDQKDGRIRTGTVVTSM